MVEPSCNFLSDTLREYYDNHGVTDLESYIQKGSSSPPRDQKNLLAQRQQQQGLRYIRLNPRYDAQETLALLEEEIKTQFSNETSLLIKKVTWMPTVLGYYAIPGSFSLSQSVAYRSGRIYGMDVSSGAAVAALLLDDDDDAHHDVLLNAVEDDRVENTTPIMRILDLCCAPGLKTCAIMDILSTDIKCRAHVVGVDISEQRLQLCKNVIRKYHLDPDTSCGASQQRRCFLNSNDATTSVTSTKDSNVTIQLFQTDGTTFGMKKCQERDMNALKFDSQVTVELIMCRHGNRKRMNKSAKAREQKRLKEIMSTNCRLEERRRLVQPAEGAIGAAGVSSVVATTTTAGATTTNDNMASTQDEDHEEIIIPLFDRVLVDAECSTDGAIRHLWHKCKKSSMTKNNQNHHHKGNLEENLKLTDSLQLKELVELQKKLISSGFRLLKPGGIMVYSTCSLAQEQNECVVSWLLKEYGASVEILPALGAMMDKKGVGGSSKEPEESQWMEMSKNNIVVGGIPGTVRFHPSIQNEGIGGSSGFFLAKLRKRKGPS